MTDTTARAVEVLLAARDAVGPDTWTQGAMHDGRGRSCLMGHMCRRPTFELDVQVEAHAALQEATGSESMMDWNDAPARTWQEVRDALDAAATALKGRT